MKYRLDLPAKNSHIRSDLGMLPNVLQRRISAAPDLTLLFVCCLWSWRC